MFPKRFSQSKTKCVSIAIGCTIGGLMSLFEALANYLDTAPVDESFLASTLQMLDAHAGITFLVYTFLGGCLGLVVASLLLKLRLSVSKPK